MSTEIAWHEMVGQCIILNFLGIEHPKLMRQTNSADSYWSSSYGVITSKQTPILTYIHTYVKDWGQEESD